jgi:hypothetical protein
MSLRDGFQPNVIATQPTYNNVLSVSRQPQQYNLPVLVIAADCAPHAAIYNRAKLIKSTHTHAHTGTLSHSLLPNTLECYIHVQYSQEWLSVVLVLLPGGSYHQDPVDHSYHHPKYTH